MADEQGDWWNNAIGGRFGEPLSWKWTWIGPTDT
jgi:hypothetical protein